MSGILGVFNPDGRPAAPETLAAMMQALADWGPDGSGAWREGPVGLGHLLLYNTPESLHERQPYHDEAAGLTITARARLDNREELADALGMPHPGRPTLPDSALILRAYEKWGEDCVHRLLGDWCFAVWDSRARKLFLARDHFGNTGLYYYGNGRSFYFASGLKGLLALPEIPRRLHELRLAQILVSWPGEGVATCYREVFRLPPAHLLTVTSRGVKVRQYWRLEDTPPLRLGSDEEYLEAFRDLYTRAVRCRLRSHRPVGVTLSGGLDSGSVTALAARELKAQGEVLPAFSSVPRYNPDGVVPRQRFGDETPFIEAAGRHAGNVEHIYIRAERVSPLDGLRAGLRLHDEPGHAGANYFWIVALLGEARSRGIGTLLTGQGGNATVSFSSPGYLFGLARAGQWRTLQEELLRLRAVQQRPWWRILGGQLARPLLAPYLYPYLHRLKQSGREPWAGYAAILPDFARRLSLLKLMRAGGHDPYFSPIFDGRKMQLAIIRPGSSALGNIWQEAGAAFGLEVRDPTLDKRLLEFCLAIPAGQYDKGGVDRRLIRGGLQGLMAPRVLENRRRGLQAADLGWRLRDSRQEVAEALRQVADSPRARQYLDIDKMRAILDSLKTGVTWQNTQDSGTILLRGLMAGLFVLQNEFTSP